MSRRECVLRLASLSIVLVLASISRDVSAQDAGVPRAGDAGLLEASRSATSSAALELARVTEQIRALLDGTLDARVDPKSLFVLPLSGSTAAELEAARLRSALGAAESVRGDAGSADDGGDSSAEEARIALDRARLAFYELSPEQRSAVLAAHAEKRATPPPSSAEGRSVSEVAEERERALDAARHAHSEAERLMSEEQARLLSVEQAQREREARITQQRSELAARRESVRRYSARAKELREAASSEAVDVFYDTLRASLDEARSKLDVALDQLSQPPSVPRVAPERMLALPPELDTRSLDETRARVARGTEALRGAELHLLEDTVAELVEEVDHLNRERLSLLDLLSKDKRTAITGFTLAALGQAADELGHLTLVLRYHRHVTTRWFAAPSALPTHASARTTLREAIGAALLVFARLAFALLLFVWWRKQSPKLLASLREYLEREDRERRRAGHSPLTSAVRFVEQIRVPLGRVVLVLLIGWLLPAGAERLVEVQLLFVIALWILGGALAVRVVDALAGSQRGDETAALRLRSLTLVGRVVVAYGLVLAISAQLVGRGTIYHWVLFTCWFASLPVFLVLVRWWREIVFEKIAAVRRKSVFDGWILENRDGYRSFIAASLGGVYLFTRGVVRATRVFVSSFDLSRHLLAYLFRREIDRLTGEHAQRALHPLPAPRFRQLGPEVASDRMVKSAEEETFARILAASAEGRGGVFAIIGARGAGKSSALARLARGAPTATRLSLGEIASAVRGLAGSLSEAQSLAERAAELERGDAPGLLLIDDADRLIMPARGGLRAFDEVLGVARRHSVRTTWVFAFDDVAWSYVRCARPPRPLFDQTIVLAPFREAQIVELLQQRTRQAGLEPSFERLVDRLRPYADENHRAEMLQERALGYYRLIWNFAGGNPGVALHMWRLSLEVDDAGQPLVHPFKAFDTQDLEQLPDSAIFTLRTVLTLCSASADEVARVTLFPLRDVVDALAYAVARGYLVEESGRYRVTWTWLRPITVHLRRRQILVPA